MTAKPFSTSGVMTLIIQTGIHVGGLERLGLKREISRRKSHQEDGQVRERMDSLSRTYRSIPTAGQNSQIWYLPVQLQPGGETEDRVSKHVVLCREVPQGKMNGHHPPRTRVSYPLHTEPRQTNTHIRSEARGRRWCYGTSTEMGAGVLRLPIILHHPANPHDLPPQFFTSFLLFHFPSFFLLLSQRKPQLADDQ